MKALLPLAFCIPAVALAQSPLDVPAKTKAVTIGSEINRGYQDVWALHLPQDAEDSNIAVKRLIQDNDQEGRKTDGYVIGVHFGLWSKLEVAWEIYQEGSLAKEQYEAVASFIWTEIKSELADSGLTLPQLLQVCPVEARRIAKWKEHLNER